MPTNNELDLIVPDNNVSYEDKMNSFLVAKGVEGTGAYNPDYKCIDVLPQDPEYIGFNLYLCNELGATTLAVLAVVDAYTVTVTSATGALVGDCINIRQDSKIFQSIITIVAGNIPVVACAIAFSFSRNWKPCIKFIFT